jgi:hypothetical protein
VPDAFLLEEFVSLVEGVLRKLGSRQRAFDKLNVSGERSQTIQLIISSDVSGFVSGGRRFTLIPEHEVVDLFCGLPIGPKPDGLFWLRKPRRKTLRGVMVEVERGQSVQNNADLKDIWKCHICAHTDFLILLVPIELRQARKTEKPYKRVVARLEPFFRDGFTINISAVAVIGY